MNDKSINIWDRVQTYLQNMSNIENLSDTSSSDNEKKLLKERAKDIARPIEELSEVQTFHVTEFCLAHERYAIESSYIKEVLPAKDLMPIPFTPPFVMGIINLRGQIFSVIDLKQFFGLPEKEVTNTDKVIIVSNNNMEFGVIADKISGVSLIQYNSLQNSISTLTGIQSDYILGVTKERLIVIDIEKILNDKKIIVDEEI